MLDIKHNTVIYVLCPANIVTGGIEAVHQLVDKLRKFGHDAQIVPLPNVKNPTLLQYRNYDVKFASQVEDKSENILITTEVNPRELDHYHLIQKALWWLSVDNHEKQSKRFDFSDPSKQCVTHFVQSAYAYSFLEEKGIKTIYYLSDYLHAEYLRNKKESKTNRVLYTPIKGAETYVERLMQGDPSIQWLPLQGMIRSMHAKTLRQGKVYVDFGSHPGKDRQPREAAVNGCCVIVGLRGSARYKRDLPIPESYKFPCDPMDTDTLLSTIKSCLFDYEKRIHDFSAYADIVRQEEKRFEEEVIAIFRIKKLKERSRQAIRIHNTLDFCRQNNGMTAIRGLGNEFLPLALTNTARKVYRQTNARICAVKS